MEANAREAISIADIAAAAGCGTRALQLAFRQFRDTTPLAALRETRLLAVRAAVQTSDVSASLIAREFGFSNASRFRAAFRQRFGELPPERD
ncbi:MAG: AraC family transcriptional regulator [Alphaproteobacteria bacterium]|nr:MAG: AraC family transcriptional regulator [Alphaproteobacteria bacterium]